MYLDKIPENYQEDIKKAKNLLKKYFRVYANLDRESSNKIDLVDFDLRKDFYALLNSLGEVVELE